MPSEPATPKPSPLVPPPCPPARWSEEHLPVYRHVPGLTPHPVRHRDGHMYGQKMVPWSGGTVLPEGWSQCPPYLFGVDLFNRSYFWEAHESWEEI